MGIGQLLFGFEGRISRKAFWVASIIVTLVIVALAAVAGGIFGAVLAVSIQQANPGLTQAQLLQRVQDNLFWIVLIILPLYWPIFAIYTKRFHDLGMSGWFTILLLPSILFGAFMQNPQTLGALFTPLAVLTIITSLWMLVNLGFYRGGAGPNAYGADPLSKSA